MPVVVAKRRNWCLTVKDPAKPYNQIFKAGQNGVRYAIWHIKNRGSVYAHCYVQFEEPRQLSYVKKIISFTWQPADGSFQQNIEDFQSLDYVIAGPYEVGTSRRVGFIVPQEEVRNPPVVQLKPLFNDVEEQWSVLEKDYITSIVDKYCAEQQALVAKVPPTPFNKYRYLLPKLPLKCNLLEQHSCSTFYYKDEEPSIRCSICEDIQAATIAAAPGNL